MVVIRDAQMLARVFSIIVVVSNVLSNLTLGRSFYSLFFIQVSYQISHALRASNNFTRHNQISNFEFS